jgi:hypothetical protein
MKHGVNIVVHSFDVALFGQRLRHDIGNIKKAAGDEPAVDDSPSLVV